MVFGMSAINSILEKKHNELSSLEAVIVFAWCGGHGDSEQAALELSTLQKRVEKLEKENKRMAMYLEAIRNLGNYTTQIEIDEAEEEVDRLLGSVE